MTAQRHADPAFHEPLLLRPSRRAAARSASVSQIPSSQRLRSQLIQCGHTALTDADLLWLLLSRSRHTDDPSSAVARLLHVFGTLPRVLAARPDRLRTLASLSDDAIAAIKTAEGSRDTPVPRLRPPHRTPDPPLLRRRHRLLPRPRRPPRNRGLPPPLPRQQERPHRRRAAAAGHRQPHARLHPRSLHPVPRAPGHLDHRCSTTTPAATPSPRTPTST